MPGQDGRQGDPGERGYPGAPGEPGLTGLAGAEGKRVGNQFLFTIKGLKYLFGLDCFLSVYNYLDSVFYEMA